MEYIVVTKNSTCKFSTLGEAIMYAKSLSVKSEIHPVKPHK